MASGTAQGPLCRGWTCWVSKRRHWVRRRDAGRLGLHWWIYLTWVYVIIPESRWVEAICWIQCYVLLTGFF